MQSFIIFIDIEGFLDRRTKDYLFLRKGTFKKLWPQKKKKRVDF